MVPLGCFFLATQRVELGTDTKPDEQSCRLDIAQSEHCMIQTKSDGPVVVLFSVFLALSFCKLLYFS